ncbi:MAG: hypothetical protein MI749_11680, partial [Desulfovibrionales bacterium]|nr:hypothetical protein [Desulfovibrionales bacterium]
PTDIAVQVDSLEDPSLEPSGAGQSILPRSGHVDLVEIPVIPTGEVDGTLYLADGNGGKKILNHAPLQLVDENGAVAATTRSEFDGFYLFMKVPPGKYAVRLDPEFEKTLGEGNLPSQAVTISQEGNVVNGADLVFVPAPPAQSLDTLASAPATRLKPMVDNYAPMDSAVGPQKIFQPLAQEDLKSNHLEPILAEMPPLEGMDGAKTVESSGELALAAPRYGLHLASYQRLENALDGIAFQKEKHGRLLAAADFSIVKTDLGPKGIWYRIFAGVGSRRAIETIQREVKDRAPYAKVMALPGGGTGVHMASYKSRDQALKGIKVLKRHHPRALAHLPFHIHTVDLGPEKGVWYRVIAGNFDQLARADRLKDRLSTPYCAPMVIQENEQFSIQAASFKTHGEAVQGAKALLLKNHLPENLSIRKIDPEGPDRGYRLLLGGFDREMDARKTLTGLKMGGDPRVVHI